MKGNDLVGDSMKDLMENGLKDLMEDSLEDTMEEGLVEVSIGRISGAENTINAWKRY